MAGQALLVVGMALSHAALADFELAGPDGRRILLKDNGTWRYVEATERQAAGETTKEAGEAVLRLERRTERGNNCRFALRLVNNLPYEIRNLVPFYSAYRANGVLHETVASLSAFTALKPGDKQEREIEFSGIACQDIARVQVVGGDRCEMGELYKFTQGEGLCLARVRVVASDIVRFEK
jgi:hypothetical protein